MKSYMKAPSTSNEGSVDLGKVAQRSSLLWVTSARPQPLVEKMCSRRTRVPFYVKSPVDVNVEVQFSNLPKKSCHPSAEA